MIIKGTVFVITNGEYSDYMISGHFKALKDLSLKKTREDYIESLPMVPVMEHGKWIPKDDLDKARDAAQGRRFPLVDKYVRYPNPIATGEMCREYSTVDGFQAYMIRQGLVENLDIQEYNYDYLKEGD